MNQLPHSNIKLPAEKTFDLNLKVNFENGRISLALPQQFKKQPIENFTYGTPIRQQQNCHPTINTAYSTNGSQVSMAETIEGVNCILCGRTYLQNEFQQHIQFHRNRGNLNTAPNQNKSLHQSASDKLQQQSVYSFQPIQYRNVNSIHNSLVPSRHSSPYLVEQRPIFQDLERKSQQYSLSYSQQTNCYPQSMYQQPSVHCSKQLSHFHRANSMPNSKEFYERRADEFYDLNTSGPKMHNQTLPHGYTLHYTQQIPHFTPANQSYCFTDGRRMINESLSVRNNSIPHGHFYQDSRFDKSSLSSNHKQNSQCGLSFSNNTIPRQPGMNTNMNDVEEFMNYSYSRENGKRMTTPEQSISVDKTKKMQANSLYMSFKEQQQDEQSEDNDFGSGKPILERMSDSFFQNKSSRLGQSNSNNTSQISDKSRSSKTKIPVNYLARQQFIETTHSLKSQA